MELIKGKFVNNQNFYDFHREEVDRNILFIDIPEEEFIQQKVRAEVILEQMQKDFQISAEEILDDISTRNLFDDVIRMCLKIKKEQAKRVRNAIEEDYK